MHVGVDVSVELVLREHRSQVGGDVADHADPDAGVVERAQDAAGVRVGDPVDRVHHAVVEQLGEALGDRVRAREQRAPGGPMRLARGVALLGQLLRRLRSRPDLVPHAGRRLLVGARLGDDLGAAGAVEERVPEIEQDRPERARGHGSILPPACGG